MNDSITPTLTKKMKFHGEQTRNDGDHIHYNPDPRDLESKSIKKFVCDASNIWSLHFTDGTSVAIQTEISRCGIPYMELCGSCAQND